MSTWTQTAARLTRGWAAAYTVGLARDVRQSRRREIASDIWEHQHDAEDTGFSAGVALQMISRTLRGMPADLLWRINVEGPQMDIRIPIERIVGAMLVAMVAMVLVTGSISGIDTAKEGFGAELIRLADLSGLENAANAAFRIATGLFWIAVAATLFVALRERAPVFSALVGFGLLCGAALELVATGLQIVLVELADDYVGAAPAEQATALWTARAVALAVQATTTIALGALLMSVYTMALATVRESLVPRWLIGLPLLSALCVAVGIVAATAGAGDTTVWILTMSGLLLGLAWLLVAGLWLLVTAHPEAHPTRLAAGTSQG